MLIQGLVLPGVDASWNRCGSWSVDDPSRRTHDVRGRFAVAAGSLRWWAGFGTFVGARRHGSAAAVGLQRFVNDHGHGRQPCLHGHLTEQVRVVKQTSSSLRSILIANLWYHWFPLARMVRVVQS